MNMTIRDFICPRCSGTFQNTDRVLSVNYGNVIFSICPKCTKEVAEIMGYTEETLTKELARITYAQTENNKKYDIECGDRCAKCEARFTEGDVRVSMASYSNSRKYHLACYDL